MSTSSHSSVRFSDWKLSDAIMGALQGKEWEFATPIQAESIPLALSRAVLLNSLFIVKLILLSVVA